ncbi:hypothetical protein [Methylocella tundrae]|uniref:Uncharacterized protein n=1 Tax=Methylocella tundrae TaxID=227605 RepID=A0A4U8Z579_METTU|nr:hypothetical protein [Methylocella tundrae]WPP04314.1 hypothetical protein SIN04_18010 [Methylocella tundrae]VFU10645.1 protein of unknown function [Methylocella tundrae]
MIDAARIYGIRQAGTAAEALRSRPGGMGLKQRTKLSGTFEGLSPLGERKIICRLWRADQFNI